MINNRLIIVPSKMPFSQWELPEWRRNFKEVRETRKHRTIGCDDIVLVYSCTRWMTSFANVSCRAKFSMLFPGYGFQPLKNPKVAQELLPVIDKYTAVFVNEGPVWEVYKGHPKVFLVSYSAAHTMFKKTRRRDMFKRIIQVARNEFYKGRHISETAMKMMPYNWELIPRNMSNAYKGIRWTELHSIYQGADGFLSPNMIGPSPEYSVDAKYNQCTMEAGLSGCLIFWHDCMKTGNSFETVFPISLDPKEIAQKVQDIVGSIDLEKHSQATAQEFYEKCNAEQAVKAKTEVMKRFL